jgi:hypothetical protein
MRARASSGVPGSQPRAAPGVAPEAGMRKRGGCREAVMGLGASHGQPLLKHATAAHKGEWGGQSTKGALIAPFVWLESQSISARSP